MLTYLEENTVFSGRSAGKKTVPATQYAQALDEIQRLQKLLGRAVSDNELLKEAVEMMSGEKFNTR